MTDRSAGVAVEVDGDPAEVGVDAGRLAHIDTTLRRYVDDGRLAGWQVHVTRRGRTVHASCHGMRDLEAGLPVEPDTLWRVYSMTKPVTTVAAMRLYERGLFSLTDEVSRFLPAYADMRILRGGTAQAPQTVPATEPMLIWHLLTHTAGMSYGFTRSSPVDEMYRDAGSDFLQPAGMDLAAVCDLWAGLPLLFEPGAAWNYSVATDVLGRIVEVLTGKALDAAVSELVLDPLGMSDTTWWVPPAQAHRLAALYVPAPGSGTVVRHDALGREALREPELLSGGGGLVSTAADYARFTQLLVRGGELDGERLLGPRTLAYMGRNHLPGGQTLANLGRGPFAETAYEGMGFGLGFGVLVDPVGPRTLASAGELTWGGAASTAFWVDPAEQLTAHLYTQLLPSGTYPLRSMLRQLVYQALVD